MGSRAVILPASCWRAMRAWPPPSRRRASSVSICSTRWRMCAWRATSTLFQLGEIGRVHVYRLGRFGEDCAVFLGFGGDFLPFRIGPERRPVLLGRFQAGVHHDVDQRGLGFFRFLRDPVAPALNAVALEEL